MHDHGTGHGRAPGDRQRVDPNRRDRRPMTSDARSQLIARVAALSGAAIAFAIGIASCGHGAQSVAPGPDRGDVMKVQFHITVPTPAPLMQIDGHIRPHQHSTVNPYYVSSGTTEAAVIVTPQGGVPYPAVDFACTSASCTG